MSMAAAVLLATSTTVVGLDPHGIPHPRPARKRRERTFEELTELAAKHDAEMASTKAAVDAAQAKRERKAAKLKQIAEAGGIDTVV